MTDNTETEAPETEAKPARIKQNGVTRPAEGTTTGNIWLAADQLTEHYGRMVLMAELREHLGDSYNKATVATQYNAWCTFNGVTAADRKAIRDAQRAEREAAKKAEKEAAKAAKAAEKAEAEEQPAE